MRFPITEIEKKKDSRGFLVEFLKDFELEIPQKEFKQIYLATIAPGTIRGNHYHKEKYEWVTFINGKTQVVLLDIKTNEKKDFIVDSSQGDTLKRVLIKPFVAHAFKNISDSTTVLIAYTNKVYDSKNPDTFDYRVL